MNVPMGTPVKRGTRLRVRVDLGSGAGFVRGGTVVAFVQWVCNGNRAQVEILESGRHFWTDPAFLEVLKNVD